MITLFSALKRLIASSSSFLTVIALISLLAGFGDWNDTTRDIHARNTKGETLLMVAVKRGSLPQVKKLLSLGAHVDARSFMGKTALMLAAKRGDLAVMRELIKAGADVNAVWGLDWPSMGEPVLRFAIDSGSAAAVRLLLQAGANPNGLTGGGLFKEHTLQARNNPLLTYAVSRGCSIDIVDQLIAGGAEIDGIGPKALGGGWTALMVAVYNNNHELTHFLLERGANPCAENGCYGQELRTTPFDYARRNDNKHILQLLDRYKVYFI